MEVYVCYEENNHDQAIQKGTISDMAVLLFPDKAKEWFLERVKAGKEEGFFIDKENEMSRGDGDVNEEALARNIREGYAELILFAGYQENWDESYSIIVQEMEAE